MDIAGLNSIIEANIPPSRMLASATGVKEAPAYAGLAGAGALTLVLMFGRRGLASLLSDLVALGYPALASMKALETPGPEDDKQWLTYWIVMALFQIAENFLDVLLAWVPFYWLIKTLFCVYLMLPQTRGAQVLYKSLKPNNPKTQ